VSADELSNRLAAIASPQRMRIIAALAGERLHVSELARRVGMSRALLYMHLARLEEAGFVTGHLELGSDGKALKFFEAVPFSLMIDMDTLVDAVKTDPSVTTLESENN
jgi:DNA-binding transcriptional ArsR family regulator